MQSQTRNSFLRVKVPSGRYGVLRSNLRPMLFYLGRLKRRMNYRGFLQDDPPMQAVCGAEDAIHTLSVEVHYLSCEGGVGRTPGVRNSASIDCRAESHQSFPRPLRFDPPFVFRARRWAVRGVVVDRYWRFICIVTDHETNVPIIASACALGRCL